MNIYKRFFDWENFFKASDSPRFNELMSGSGGSSGFICTAFRTCPTAFRSYKKLIQKL